MSHRCCRLAGKTLPKGVDMQTTERPAMAEAGDRYLISIKYYADIDLNGAVKGFKDRPFYLIDGKYLEFLYDEITALKARLKSNNKE